MSLHHFFLENQVISEIDEPIFKLDLSDDDIKHARVLRLKAGEKIAVVDSSNDYFVVELVDIDSRGIIARISSKENMPKPAFSITLFQGVPKSDKFDEIIKHATEVGVDSFIPVQCSRSVSKLDDRKASKKQIRWQGIAKSAAMQSGRLSVPSVLLPLSIQEASNELENYDVAVVFYEEASSEETISKALAGIKEELENGGRDIDIAVVIGPEGGFDVSEVLCLTSLPNAKLATLGSNILRTETAGVVAPALVKYELERPSYLSG